MSKKIDLVPLGDRIIVEPIEEEETGDRMVGGRQRKRSKKGSGSKVPRPKRQ